MYSAIRRKFSSFGLVRVFEMVAPVPSAADTAPEIEGIRFEWDDPAAPAVEIRALDGDRVLGTIKIAAHSHLDPFYRSYSEPDATHAYASALEVSADARGRGLGTALVQAARQVASDDWGRGYKCFVGRDNASSLHCHSLAGVNRRSELDGIRLGGPVHWLRRRLLT